jgi:chromosome segregation ATPase
MNFLSFLKERDNNRRRSKRIVINLLYLLIPVVILANNFSSNKIIADCEVIYITNTELEEKIILLEKECNTSISILDEQRERIKQEVAELERQRDTILLGNSDLAEIAETYKNQRDTARNQRDLLQLVVDSLQLALYTTEVKLSEETVRADLCDIKVTELEADLEACDIKVAGLEADLEACDTKVAGLEADLEACDTKVTGLEADLEVCDTKVTGLEADLEACNTRSDKFEKDLADCLNNASNTDYEVTFSQVLDDSPAFSKPAEHTLLPSYKYEVIVNGKIVTYVCPGECSN